MGLENLLRGNSFGTLLPKPSLGRNESGRLSLGVSQEELYLLPPQMPLLLVYSWAHQELPRSVWTSGSVGLTERLQDIGRLLRVPLCMGIVHMVWTLGLGSDPGPAPRVSSLVQLSSLGIFGVGGHL